MGFTYKTICLKSCYPDYLRNVKSEMNILCTPRHIKLQSVVRYPVHSEKSRDQYFRFFGKNGQYRDYRAGTGLK